MTQHTLPNGQVLNNVHENRQGRGAFCPIHRPSAQADRIGQQYWRSDRGIMERICAHGVGHPDPDATLDEWDSIHGCDGCCQAP